MSRPTYIVTGGAGFVGSNLVARLLALEPRPLVIVYDNFRSGSYANIVEACERLGVGAFDGVVEASSSADTVWNWALTSTGADAIFHLGAITDTTVMDEALMMKENTLGFGEMLSSALASPTCRAVVYASSAATYGTPPETGLRCPFPESSAGKPNNVYGFSKWVMENEHRRFAEGSGLGMGEARPTLQGDGKKRPKRAKSVEGSLHVVGLRYFNVFGPGETRKGKMASMVYQLARQMLEGKRPRIFADGSQLRDQVYVDDVVSCTMAAAGLWSSPSPRKGKKGGADGPRSGIYNLGSGVATSFNDIVSALRVALDIPEAKLATDYFEMPGSIRAFYQEFTQADMSHTAKGLGWSPAWSPRDAMIEYGRWLRAGASPTAR